MNKTWYSYRDTDLFGSYISQKKILNRYKDYFCESYFNILYRDNKWLPIPLENAPENAGPSFHDVIKVIKEKKQVDIISTWYHKPRCSIRYDGESFSYNGQTYTEEKLIDKLSRFGLETAIIECPDNNREDEDTETVITVVVLNTEDTPEIADAYYKTESGEQFNRTDIDISTGKNALEDIDGELWRNIKELVISMSDYLSTFDLMRYEMNIYGNRIVLRKIQPQLSEHEEESCSEVLKTFTTQWKYERDNPTPERVETLKSQSEFSEKWSHIAEQKYRKGMRAYMAALFEDEMQKDNEDPSTTEEEKKWAHDRGFFSYRIGELGLNEDNYGDFVSDRDYFWVNRINNHYQPWIAEKLPTRYVLDEYRQYLPEYYYEIRNINGRKKVIALPDLPEGYERTEEEIIRLLQEKKVLAIKANYGSHGDGFFKMEALGEKVLLNGEEMTPDEALSIVSKDETTVLVTEYVNMHPFLKNIYPGSLNTVRINCFTEAGKDPQIGACFVKIGHSKGGYTDNINTAAGGIIVELDKTNGEIVLPEFKIGNQYYPCEVHPDTNIPISGMIPRWQEIIETVKKIVSTMPQLEYFGFDVAVTEDGVKIIEINVFPDYTKYIVRDRITQDFLRRKIVDKCCKEKISYLNGGSREKLFSIIVPTYNVEQYLDKTMQSIIDQTIGFEENIQVIIVDDGSKDGTYRKAMQYCRKFPQNIICISKENGGVSSARNEGLKYSTGKYVTFTDGDDYWNSDALEHVAAFYEDNDEECDVVECRTKWFEARSGYYSLDYRFDRGTRVVDIFAEPECLQVAVNSAFVKRSAIEDNSFLEQLTIGEDARFINEIIFRKSRYGIIREAVYNRRQRKAGNSITQSVNREKAESIYINTPNLYYRYMYDLSRELYGKVIPYVQYLIMDAVRYRLNLEIPELLDEEIKDEYRKILLDLVQETDEEILLDLRNGSIGERANLLKYKLKTDSDEFISIKGSDVIVKSTVIGKINLNVALGINSVMKKKGDIIVKGNLTLPWYVKEPRIYYKTGRIAGTQLLIHRENSRFMDMMGDEYYNRYSFEVRSKAKKEMKLQMYLKIKDKELYFRPNLVKGYKNNMEVKQEGENLILKTNIKSIPRRIKKKISRVMRKIVK